MLVLTRHEGEEIFIKTPHGEEIKIVLVQYKGVKTLVGIDAPKDYVIYRADNKISFEEN